MPRLIINSESSGSYHVEKRGGRSFLVTQMIPIVSDSVMNGLLYPASAVHDSYTQLNKLPAPAGHPEFDGAPVSAFDPEGAAAFNVGAFVRNPETSGSSIVADLVVDMAVANQSKQGQEIIERIQNKRRMGVSTGLKAKVANKEGKQGDTEYHGIVNQIEFDHVAILLSEPPAGEFTYTLNSSDFFKPKKEELPMREVTIDTSNLSLEDHKFLQNCAGDAQAFVKAVKHDVTEKEAAKVLVNAGKQVVSVREYEDFIVNSEMFAEYKENKKAARTEQVEFVVNNSAMQEADISEMSDGALQSLVNSIKPKNTHIVNGKVEEPKFIPLEDA